MLNHLEQFFDSLWEKLLNKRKDIAGEGSSTDSALQWDSWELDPKFFKALTRWTIDHPDTTLDGVLKNVCDAIDRGRDLLEVIPDAPFPARSLLKALGCLVKLGATISRAQADVVEFAKEIIHWVSEMRSAFAGRKGGRFTSQTKENLKTMRTLIDEICKWATARLNDGRWSRITHGLTIAQEIDEFKARIASARALFSNISIINISQGLDTIIKEIEKVRKMQKAQLKDIKDRLDAQKQVEERERFLSQTLSKRTVANATYDEQGKQPCDEDTRKDILADIKEWVYDMSSRSQSFLWLTGDPGSGKSAITASVARECKDAGILWAQFFINRNNADTTDPRSYFPSIARQLADHILDSAVTHAIHDALKIKPSLMDDISSEQASKLFLDALEAASALDRQKPVVVVIDGLDETDRSRLRVTADIFSALFSRLGCCNAKVFISSRTEDDIQKPFSKAFDVQHVKHLHLDTSAESSIQDVSTFLRRRIGDIVEKNDLNWEAWPGEERMQALCDRASGLFIWATTVVKFFQEQIRAMGKECLNELVDAVSAKGMGDINMLYGAILHLVYKDRSDPWAFETFRRVVGCIVVLREPLSLAEIEDLLDLRQTPSSDRVDIQQFVRQLRTVLVAGTDAIDGQTVPRLHKSFFEFISSKRANVRFRIDLGISNGELAMRCLLQLAGATEKQAEVSDTNTSSAVADAMRSRLAYALQFWSSHLPQDSTVTSGVAMVCSATCVIQPSQLRQSLRFSSEDMDDSTPVNVTLSPDRGHITMSRDVIRRWNRANEQWMDPVIQGLPGAVFSVAFSPDGKRVVSGSFDATVRIWDRQIGQPIGSPFQGHIGWVRSVAFSPDGKRVVSGGNDKTIRIWDSQTGQPIGSPFQGHIGSVYSVAFSPDGMRIVSGSDDKTIRIWDSQTGQPIGSSFQGHANLVYSVAFSPDGKRIVSGSFDNTIQIWDSQTGQPIGSPFRGHTNWVYSVAFSPDGKRVVSGSNDKTIQIWDSQTGQPIGSPFQGHTGPVWSVAFSPDGMRIVSGSGDKTIRIWDSQTGQPIKSPFQGHTNWVYSVAFSPDGKQVVSGSADHRVLIWDTLTGQVCTCHVRAIAYSPDTTYLVAVYPNDTVLSWDLKTHSPTDITPKYTAKDLFSVSISPDGTRIAMASLNGTVYLLNTATHLPASPPVATNIDGFTSLNFSPDSLQLILASVDGRTCVMNAANGKQLSHTTPLDGFSGEIGISLYTGKGWKGGESNEILLQWFPRNNSLWAYVSGKVIRSNGGTSVTVIDLGKRQGASV